MKGAGYDRTNIDAEGHDYGLEIGQSRNVTLCDLTIRNAAAAGVHVDGGGAVTLARLRLLHNLCGANIQYASAVRLEDMVVAGNRNGVSFAEVSGGILVNCTVADNYAVGLTIAKSQQITAFNNAITGNNLGFYLPTLDRTVRMDYNLWAGNSVGKTDGEIARGTVTAWSALTGLERHSVKLPVSYADAAGGEYAPVSPLSWRPSYMVTSGWGIEEFAGTRAPGKDIRGRKWSRDPDAGAYATGVSGAVVPDGRFKIASSEGTKSAGIFRKGGKLVCYLFQALPLKQGSYDFSLPARDFLGKPIPAGDYQVRLVESKVSSEFLGYANNKLSLIHI